jgi:hypothetical protein
MPANGAAMKSKAVAAHRSGCPCRSSARARPNSGSDSANVFPAYASMNACSSCDELGQDSSGDVSLGCLNAIAHPPCAGIVIAIMEDT